MNTYGIIPATEMSKKVLPTALQRFTVVREARGKYSIWDHEQGTYRDGERGSLRCIPRSEADLWQAKLEEMLGK